MEVLIPERVQLWHCPLAEALARLLASTAGRAFAPLEEALLLRELANDTGLSQHELARRTGRHASWVNRRLQLLSALSEELLEAVCAGRLSCWAAVRIFAPLARANAEHAHALLASVSLQPLSTRELGRWYAHYTRANRTTRERLVAHPHLFVQALDNEHQGRDAERVRAGPEGEWAGQLAQIARRLERLRAALPVLLAGGALDPELHGAFIRAQRAFERLAKEFEHHASDDPSRATPEHPHAARAGRAVAPDQPLAAALAQHRASDPARVPGGAGR
jgi:transcriptional regulator with XRE-family HTH domain